MSRKLLALLVGLLALFVVGIALPAVVMRADARPRSHCNPHFCPTTATTTTVPTTTTAPTTTTSPPPPPPPPPPSSGVIASEAAVFLGNSLVNQTNTNLYGLVGTGIDEPSVENNPGQKQIRYGEGRLCYVDDMVASADTCRANGWLVHDCNNQEILNFGGAGSLARYADPGNVAYQNDLKSRILNWLHLHPNYDGLYLDEFGMDQYEGCYPIKNQSNNVIWNNASDFQAAELSMISNVGAAVKAAGYIVGVNSRGAVAGDNANDDGVNSIRWMDRYAPYVSAAMIEYWQQQDCCGIAHTTTLEGDDAWYHHWNGWQAVIARAYADGIAPWPASYIAQSEDKQCRFLRGSFLLEWNGASGYGVVVSWNGSNIWSACTAFNPGTPTGPKTIVSTSACGLQTDCHAYRRDFTNGYVIVNPTWTTVTVGSDTIPSGDAVLRQQ